jgi:hypothetical protein
MLLSTAVHIQTKHESRVGKHRRPLATAGTGPFQAHQSA